MTTAAVFRFVVCIELSVCTELNGCGMGGRSPVVASDEPRAALASLAGSRDRGEADRARRGAPDAVGLDQCADRGRVWRARGHGAAVAQRVRPGRCRCVKGQCRAWADPVKSEAALRVVTPPLEEPVADRPNWTPARLRAEVEARAGVRISRSPPSKALRKEVPVAAAAAHAEGAPECQRGGSDRPAPAPASGRSRRHRPSVWRRERGVDAPLSRPRVGRFGADPRVPAPGQARKVAMLGSLDHVTRQLIVHASPTRMASVKLV